MLAAISEGHPDLADGLFLAAFILFLLAAALSVPSQSTRPGWLNATTVMLLGLACIALAWFVL